MRQILNKHKECWIEKSFLISSLSGGLFLSISVIFHYVASNYAARSASNSVTDILLDNLPTFNVGGIFVYGAALLAVFTAILLIFEPRRIPFVIKSFALFLFIRAVFITLTHIGPIPGEAPLDSNIIVRGMMFGGDLFFSGHTGFPFLMALSFWHKKYLRILFLIASLVFGACAILGRFHYSIDVFAAFFITYTIFAMAKNLFAKDYALFLDK